MSSGSIIPRIPGTLASMLSRCIESDAELGAAYLFEDHTSEECVHSPKSALPESCLGPPESSPHSGSWDLISLPLAGLSFTPASHPGDSVRSTQLASPLRPRKAHAHMPVQAPHHISQLLRPRNAWPAKDELPPRSGPTHGAPCLPTGGLPPPAYSKRFHMALPTAQPKPAPTPRPPPLNTSLNRPAPLPQTPLHQPSAEDAHARLQQGSRLWATIRATATACSAQPPHQAPSRRRAPSRLRSCMAPVACFHRQLQPTLGRDVPFTLAR